jgi:hypothetical protein
MKFVLQRATIFQLYLVFDVLLHFDQSLSNFRPVENPWLRPEDGRLAPSGRKETLNPGFAQRINFLLQIALPWPLRFAVQLGWIPYLIHGCLDELMVCCGRACTRTLVVGKTGRTLDPSHKPDWLDGQLLLGKIQYRKMQRGKAWG